MAVYNLQPGRRLARIYVVRDSKYDGSVRVRHLWIRWIFTDLQGGLHVKHLHGLAELASLMLLVSFIALVIAR